MTPSMLAPHPPQSRTRDSQYQPHSSHSLCRGMGYHLINHINHLPFSRSIEVVCIINSLPLLSSFGVVIIIIFLLPPPGGSGTQTSLGFAQLTSKKLRSAGDVQAKCLMDSSTEPRVSSPIQLHMGVGTDRTWHRRKKIESEMEK